ncbi:MAG TPA: hypothetical protein VII38_14530 [Polyangia bacterium]|jgi:plastocyanin
MRCAAWLLLLWPSVALAGSVRGRVLASAGDTDGVPHVALLIDDGVAPAQKAQLGERWLSFYPKVQVVPLGSTLAVSNSDDESHSVHGWLGDETLFNLASVPDGGAESVRFDRAGVVTLTCDIHRSMRAYVLVTPSAHAAVTGLDGRFTLNDVPKGRWPIRAWQPGDDASGSAIGKVVATVEVGERPVELTLILPPPAQRELARASTPTADEVDPARPPAWTGKMQQLVAGWPRGPWKVIPLSIFAVLLGLAAAFGNFRLAARRGWPKAPVFFAGCVAAIGAGLLVIVGLSGPVATGLGFGLFLGTAIFGALELAEDPPPQ